MACLFSSLLVCANAYVLAQGQPKTGKELCDLSRKAYASLKTYQGVTKTTATVDLGVGGGPNTYHTSATIAYASPGKINVEGDTMFGGKFAYRSDGKSTWETSMTGGKSWNKADSPEMAIAGATGVAMSAGTTIPTLLLKLKWGQIFESTSQPAKEIKREKVGTVDAYRVEVTISGGRRTLWIDPKSFLMIKMDEFRDMSKLGLGGAQKAGARPSTMHSIHVYSQLKVNNPIPASTFAKPSGAK
jgi:hypothetical protein